MTPRMKPSSVTERLTKERKAPVLKLSSRDLADIVHMQAMRLESLACLCDRCSACRPYDAPAIREMAQCLDTLDARLRKHPKKEEAHGD